MVTWGARPQDVAPIDGAVPDPAAAASRSGVKAWSARSNT
jgi:hypothetical protein